MAGGDEGLKRVVFLYDRAGPASEAGGTGAARWGIVCAENERALAGERILIKGCQLVIGAAPRGLLFISVAQTSVVVRSLMGVKM